MMWAWVIELRSGESFMCKTTFTLIFVRCRLPCFESEEWVCVAQFEFGENGSTCVYGRKMSAGQGTWLVYGLPSNRLAHCMGIWTTLLR